MKKLIIFNFFLLITFCKLFAQVDQIDFNTLNAPATPAATLLGFAPSEIDKPRDASAFLGSIVTQTDGLSNLPSNYAVEIAPAWMFGSRRRTFDKFSSNDSLWNNIWQSLTLSAAVRRSEASEDKPLAMTQVAFGLKFSLSRGNFSDSTQNLIDSTVAVLGRISRSLSVFLSSDSVYQLMLDRSIESLEDTVLLSAYRQLKYREFESIREQELKKLKADIEKNRFIRTGFKLDLTAGIVQDYPNDNYDERTISKFGAWLTAGYEGEKGGTILGIARLLKSPDADYMNENGEIEEASILSSDLGVRGLWTPTDKPWSISGEALYRKVYEPKELDANWRWTVNLEYKINTELSLNFSYGRDFEGTVTRDGNVVALLSMFTSFGNKKPVN